MKWRNQLLALVCLVAFGALGVVYFQHWVIRKPFGIILFVGEGLSPARLAPTRTYAAGAGARLNMDLMPYAALVMHYSKDFAAPDQAAAAPAICCLSFVAMDSISSERARTWKQFTPGDDPSCSAFSIMIISLSPIRLGKEGSSPVFPTWSGERFNYCSTIPAVICLS